MQMQLKIPAMHCGGCAQAVRRAVLELDPGAQIDVDLQTRTVQIESKHPEAHLHQVLAEAGYPPQKAGEAEDYGQQVIADDSSTEAVDEQEAVYRRTMGKFAFAAAIAVPVLLVGLGDYVPALARLLMPYQQVVGLVSAVLSLAVLAWSGADFFKGAWHNFRNHNANMDTLIALGTGAAWLYSFFVVVAPGLFPVSARGTFFDVAVVVTALVLLGQALEARARGRANAALGALLNLQAKTARVIRGGQEMDLPVAQVRVGDILLVRPGEKVPVDGVIIQGESAIDESVVTGESIPVDKKPGDGVVGSSLNATGAFRMRATRVGEQTALAQIVRLVSEAQSTKVPIARLVDTVSRYFVPGVAIVAILTFLVWFNLGAPLNLAVVAAVTVLVIACPCALGLAAPISLVAGLGRAAEHGILVRNGEALETAAKLKTIVLDKTGTITRGRPELTDVLPVAGFEPNELLALAAAADRNSEHPLAAAIVRGARERGLAATEAERFQAIPGQGVTATVGGRTVLVGNSRLMAAQAVATEAFSTEVVRLADAGKTAMFVAVDGEAAGILAVADAVKPDSIEAIRTLRQMGIEVVMITGDNERTARAIARTVGIERVRAGVQPEEKAHQVQLLQAGRTVGMVGDGVNDAPALAQADVGFAIGTGTDVAIEAAGITLVGGSLRSVVYAIEISRATLGNIKQNLFGAFIYNILGIPVAAGLFYPLFGWLLSPILAGGAMALSSITVVLNASRLRSFSVPEV